MVVDARRSDFDRFALCDVNPKGNRPKFPNRSFSKKKMSSGMSLSRKQALIAGGGLASMYIGFKMASQPKYTICEGPRNELGPDLVMRQYRYTVCPSHLRYCCLSDLYMGERCCAGRPYFTHSSSRGTTIGSLFGTLMMILCIGLIIYFCCLRRRSKSSTQVLAHDPDELYRLPTSLRQPTSIGTGVTVGGYAPAFDHQVPPPPVPSGPDPIYYPENPPPSYFDSTRSNQPPPYPDVIPPNQSPYPPAPPADNASAPPYPTPSSQHPGAPIGSGWSERPPITQP
ncbi:unnamed protein product [Rodentolepis nana]|uniref:EGF-like domain-containing protein n=1 Tax=Rodentolepis nana TaxID=102285 RepID=A0A0R3TBH5_RODNA|nr:unnamed protein product [Rodentolepis nana]